MAGQVGKAQSTILVIDDDEVIRTIITEGLQRAGYDVCVAENGCFALEFLQTSTPDLIISDVNMPELDGMTLLTQLRSSPTLRAIPVIMVTALGSTDDIIAGFDLGADDYLVKPFSMAELLARVRSKIERPPVPSDMLTFDRQTGFLTERVFNLEADREVQRAARGGMNGVLAYLSLAEWANVQEKLGTQAASEILHQLAGLLATDLLALDLTGRTAAGTIGLLFPEINSENAQRKLNQISAHIASTTFAAGKEHVRLTPAIGYVNFSRGAKFDEVQDNALTALDQAVNHLDLTPRLYAASMGSLRRQAVSPRVRLKNLRARITLPGEIILTYLIGWVLPFLIYWMLDRVNLDISTVVYLMVVVALALTGIFIWVEGFLSLKKMDPPLEPGSPYPMASAIIAAYLPNEASTLLETIEAFLKVDYPAGLQIILAYNTPYDMPIEETLRQMAKRDARFQPMRIQNSTSKAQNVNAALAEVKGDFVGIFDADHHPRPDSFRRAWRWLSTGYDVVQGHCQVRNGDATWVARMVAVEFEVIYGSSHPGRNRWHQFGIFGGSNGYWKTDLLRKTRMRGFMLTEDIDSSFRALEDGAKIISDPGLYSLELAPVNLNSLWNQRMRWAQGWTQVSVKHFWRGLLSKNFSARQKLGLFWLLGWREFYPWISLQILPLITFWAIKYHGLDKLNWLIPIFVLATLFTLSVGPGQTLFAYLVGAPEIRAHKKWFWFYLLTSSLFYTEYKNLIGRVGQIKELFREKQWKVTPRSAGSTAAPEE